MQAVRCLAPLSFLIDPCSSVRSMTPKPDGFRALGVKHPKDLLTQVKKDTKLNLATLSIKENFPFLTRTLNAQ
jgi:hypothetical protein